MSKITASYNEQNGSNGRGSEETSRAGPGGRSAIISPTGETESKLGRDNEGRDERAVRSTAELSRVAVSQAKATSEEWIAQSQQAESVKVDEDEIFNLVSEKEATASVIDQEYVDVNIANTPIKNNKRIREQSEPAKAPPHIDARTEKPNNLQSLDENAQSVDPHPIRDQRLPPISEQERNRPNHEGFTSTQGVSISSLETKWKSFLTVLDDENKEWVVELSYELDTLIKNDFTLRKAANKIIETIKEKNPKIDIAEFLYNYFEERSENLDGPGLAEIARSAGLTNLEQKRNPPSLDPTQYNSLQDIDQKIAFLQKLNPETRKWLLTEASPIIDALIELQDPKIHTQIDKIIYQRPLPETGPEKDKEIKERMQINAFLKRHTDDRINYPQVARLDVIARSAELLPPLGAVVYMPIKPQQDRDSDRDILGKAIIARVLRDTTEERLRITIEYGDKFRFEIDDVRISALDVRRLADARAKGVADRAGLVTHEDREEMIDRIAKAEVDGNLETLDKHDQKRESLIRLLSSGAQKAGKAYEETSQLAIQVFDRYQANKEKPPPPSVDIDQLNIAQEEAIRLGFIKHVKQLEQLRIDHEKEQFAKERQIPIDQVKEHQIERLETRDEKTSARLAGYLFSTQSDLGAKQTRLNIFVEEMSHIRKWRIGNENLSLTDVDRRIKKTTDKKEEYWLTGLRDKVLVKIAATQRELTDQRDLSDLMASELRRIYNREAKAREGNGKVMPQPQFERRADVERIADNIIDSMRGRGNAAEMFKQFAGILRDYNYYIDKKERLDTDGLINAMGKVAERLHSENIDKVELFKKKGHLQPFLIQIGGELFTRSISEVDSKTPLERLVRPIFEPSDQRKIREATLNAYASHGNFLLHQVQQSDYYRQVTNDVARQSPTPAGYTPKMDMEGQIKDASHYAQENDRPFYESQTPKLEKVLDIAETFLRALGRSR
jgi:hypothetical protein